MVSTYTEKGADSFLGLPTATDNHKAMLGMIKESLLAEKALSQNDERLFQSSFNNILAHRNSEATSIEFVIADSLASNLAQADQVPATLIQVKALDTLTAHYFDYSNNLGGPNGDGGPAGSANFIAAIKTGFNAARGFKQQNAKEESGRVYKTILDQCYGNGITLKPDFEKEATANAIQKIQPNAFRYNG